MSWVLIAYLYGGAIVFPAPFKTEQSCRAAGENLKAEYRTEMLPARAAARYVCVRRVDA